jgi:hypothetical protein
MISSQYRGHKKIETKTNNLLHGNCRLSASSLEALNEFMTEHAEQLNRFEDLKAHADSEYEKPKRIISMADFGEDWNYSQVFPLSTIPLDMYIVIFENENECGGILCTEFVLWSIVLVR